MSAKTKARKANKLNRVIFDAYEKAINNGLKAGKDVTRLVERLNLLMATNR